MKVKCICMYVCGSKVSVLDSINSFRGNLLEGQVGGQVDQSVEGRDFQERFKNSKNSSGLVESKMG